MTDINVNPTAEIIDNIAKTFYKYAMEMGDIAKQMRLKKDLTYAGEAINSAVNCFQNLRLDLLATRPIRELLKAPVLEPEKGEE